MINLIERIRNEIVQNPSVTNPFWQVYTDWLLDRGHPCMGYYNCAGGHCDSTFHREWVEKIATEVQIDLEFIDGVEIKGVYRVSCTKEIRETFSWIKDLKYAARLDPELAVYRIEFYVRGGALCNFIVTLNKFGFGVTSVLEIGFDHELFGAYLRFLDRFSRLRNMEFTEIFLRVLNLRPPRHPISGMYLGDLVFGETESLSLFQDMEEGVELKPWWDEFSFKAESPKKYIDYRSDFDFTLKEDNSIYPVLMKEENR